MPNSSKLLKRAEVRPSRGGSRAKTFPKVPTILRVSCGHPESRRSMVLGLEIEEG